MSVHLTHLSCSPNFRHASYLDKHTLTYEPIVNWNQSSSKPCLIMHLVALWTLIHLTISLLFLHFVAPSEFFRFLSFLGIPRNSQKCPIMQITLATRVPSFLGIPRNSKEFSKIPNYANKLWFEKLGITGNFWEWKTPVLWGLGIPRNSQLYKLPII